MHFCQDELFAILSILPWLTVGLRWLQVRLFRKAAPLPVPQTAGPYRSACPCPEHLPKRVPMLTVWRLRFQKATGPIWPLW